MECYLVGGAVRDKLLGFPFHERDWVVVGATPQQMIDAGYQQVGSDFPVFIHPDSGEEYALARTERKSGRGYKGFDCYAAPDVTLEQDLLRRDLTINAMAECDDGTLIDPYSGQHDLEVRVLRHISPAFAEDPLRILRVARFAARYHHLGFRIAKETVELMQRMVADGEADFLVPERVWKELQRALGEANPELFLDTLGQCNALEVVLPELSSLQIPASLSYAVKTEQPATVRFALLTQKLDSAKIESLCNRVKVPNEFREMALLLEHITPLLAKADSAESYLEILEAADFARRPERFELMLEAYGCIDPENSISQKLQDAIARIAAIRPADLVSEGYKGKALGEELRKRKLEALQR